MAFFASAIDTLKILVIALGAGLGAWGVVNLLEGYGNDNPGAKSQGIKQLMAGVIASIRPSLIQSVIHSNRLPISQPLTEQAGKQRYKGATDKGNAAARHQLFHTKIGVKLCSMAGGGVSRNLWNFFRTAPAGTGQAVTCSTSGMGLRLK